MSRSQVQQHLNGAYQNWKKGKGSVVFLSAEAGLGKSHTLDWMAELCGESAIRVDCRPPIGSFNVAGIQPLQPFGHAIERLYINSEQAAKKRLAMNIGMSVLASIPIAGDLFYAVKAITQDVSEYKRDTAALNHKKRAAVAECVEMLQGVSTQTPFVLLVDDGHWSDPQSIEVLRQLIDLSSDIPLLIVWTYTSSVAQRVNLPLATLVSVKGAGQSLTIPPFTEEEIAYFLKETHPSVRFSATQIADLQKRTEGNPGIVDEYVKYLQSAGQIRADGSVDEQALQDSGLKLSSHPATEILLHEISESDSLILSLCASEGKEFTAFVVSKLMNVDIISAIREMRRLQNQTSLFKSIGGRTRYGVKTTTYLFTQGFAYTYFLHFPEYEERKLIHQRIAQILTDQYAVSELAEIQDQIATLIAAHSSEAEDSELTARMLNHSADAAESMGASDVESYIRKSLLPQYEQPDEYQVLGDTDTALDNTESAPLTSSISDVIRTCCDSLISGDITSVQKLTTQALAASKSLAQTEHVMLLCLAARAATLTGAFAESEQYIQKAWSAAKQSLQEECIIHNVHAALLMAMNNAELAKEKLHAAATLSNQLGSFARTLTLGNITLLLRTDESTSADRYERTLRRLLKSLGWQSARADLMI